MSATIKSEGLKAHNDYRRTHGSEPLQWSSKLEASAQRWANQLAKRNAMQHDSQKGEGENLACMKGRELTAKVATDMWYDEVHKYNFKKPGFSSGTGHFTQLVWAGSKELGMAHATASGGMQFVVARYHPAGNILSRFPENVKSSGAKVEAPRSEKDNKPKPTNRERVNTIVGDNNASIRGGPASGADTTKSIKYDQGSSKEFRTAITRTHNMYRKRHGSGPLKWDAELAQAALRAATDAAKTNTMKSVDMEHVGQNMAAMSGGVLSGDRVSQMWYDEEKNYDYNNPKFSTNTGSFTQVVWAGSAEFGVGRAIGNEGQTFVIALYRPAGNIRGAYEVNVGRPKGDLPVDGEGNDEGSECSCAIL